MTAHIKNKGIYLALVSQLTIWPGTTDRAVSALRSGIMKP